MTKRKSARAEKLQKCEEPGCAGFVSCDSCIYLFAGNYLWGIVHDCSVCGRLYLWKKIGIFPLFCDDKELLLVNHRIVCRNGQGMIEQIPTPISIRYL